MNNIKQRYTMAINKLMSNDSNGSWDEILVDNNNNIMDSYEELLYTLEITMLQYTETEQLFYKEIISELKK